MIHSITLKYYLPTNIDLKMMMANRTEEEKVKGKCKSKESLRNIIAFYILGITYKGAYHLMLIAAHDLLSIKNYELKAQVKNVFSCNPHSTGISEYIIQFLPLSVI